MVRIALALALGLMVGCAPAEEDAGFGGGGARPSGGSGVDNDQGQTGAVAPVITNVLAAFDDVGGSWVVAFEVSYDYPEEMQGGLVMLSLARDDGSAQAVNAEIGSSEAPLDDGNIVFAIDSIDGPVVPTSAYPWRITLESPDGEQSEEETGRVDPIR